MPLDSSRSPVGDSQRDASRYHRILLALGRATDEVRRTEAEGFPDFDQVLGKLLPDLTEALNGEQAFVAVVRGENEERSLDVAVAWPDDGPVGQSIPWSATIRKLVQGEKPVVYDPVEEDGPSIVAGLEIFGATSALMVRIQSAGDVRIVGICNKADPTLGPFIVADRMVLEYIAELVAIGFRTGQRRRRELRGIGSTAAVIGTDLHIDKVLDMTVERTAKLYDANASSYMFWDVDRKNLVVGASHGLSAKYVEKQRISAARVRQHAKALGGYRAFVTPDLVQTPFGNAELIREEGLRTALTAPLTVGDDLIGILNVYYKGETRGFSENELELLGILASHTAIAIRSRRLLEKETRRRLELLALSRVSASLRSSLGPEKVLSMIADLIIQVRGCEKAAIFLLDKENNTLNLEMARNFSDEYKAESRSLEIGPETRGVAAFEGSPVCVIDIETDRRFVAYRELARSEGFRAYIDVPMKARGEIIGVISAYYAQPHDFSADEEYLLLILANQAATAVQNAREYDALRQTQEDLSAASTVAWLGMPVAVWSHSVNQRTSAISYNIDTLRDLLSEPSVDVNDILSDIKEDVRRIQNTPLEGPLPALGNEAVVPVVVDQTLESWIPRWCHDRQDVELELKLRAGDALAPIQEEWLAAALRKPVANSLKAMPDGGQLTVSSEVAGDRIHVSLRDTGIGLPEEALEYFLKARVPAQARRNKLGSGMGALLAKFILRSFGGDMELISKEGDEGTGLRIILPLVHDS